MGLRTAGFSLMELLVVVTIIGLLASMLMPGIKLVQQVARSNACKMNLRQVQLAINGYSLDWEGLLVPQYVSIPPSNIRWFMTISPYVETLSSSTNAAGIKAESSVLWGCPVWNRDLRKKYDPTASNYSIGYGLIYVNDPLDPTCVTTNWSPPVGANVRDWQIAQLKNHANHILLGDSVTQEIEARLSAGQAVWHNDGTVPLPATSRSDARRHRTKANYAFVDGHVSTLGPTGSGWGYYDPSKFSE